MGSRNTGYFNLREYWQLAPYAQIHTLEAVAESEKDVNKFDAYPLKRCVCDPCPNSTRLRYKGDAICIECMKSMADMNSDNEEAFGSYLRRYAK